MERLGFYALTRPIQDRLVAALDGSGGPLPHASAPARAERRFLKWLALSAVGFAAGVGAPLVGYGDLDSALSIAPPGVAAVYGLFYALGLFGLMRAAALVVTHRRLPFVPGIYLFPVGVIDASGESLVKHFVTDVDLVKVLDAPARIQVRMTDGRTFDLPANDHAHAEELRSKIVGDQTHVAEARATPSPSALAKFDPLCDSGFSNPVGSTAPYRRPTPLWGTLAPLIGLAVGALAGHTVLGARNRSSEAALFAAACEASTVSSYQAYLSRGGTREEITRVRLPLAELALVEDGSSADIERFIREHADADIAAQANAALGRALGRELEVAKSKGTLAALRAFRAEHPSHAMVASEINAASHAHFTRALAEFSKTAPAWNKSLVPFMERLLAHAEAGGETVAVRFLRKMPAGVDKLEAQLRKSPYFVRKTLAPSLYFDEAHLSARENRAGKVIVGRLQRAFKEEVLRFEMLPTVLVDSELAELTQPTIVVEYTTRLSGGFMAKNPRALFVGLGINFDAGFRLPGDDAPLVFRLPQWRPPDLKAWKTGKLEPEAMYEQMAGGALDTFATKYLASFFGPE